MNEVFACRYTGKAPVTIMGGEVGIITKIQGTRFILCLDTSICCISLLKTHVEPENLYAEQKFQDSSFLKKQFG
jgi:hypothetical protein